MNQLRCRVLVSLIYVTKSNEQTQIEWGWVDATIKAITKDEKIN